MQRNHGKDHCEREGDHNAVGFRVARVHSHLAGDEFQAKSYFLVPVLSHHSFVLRGDFHADDQSQSRMEMVSFISDKICTSLIMIIQHVLRNK